MKSSLQRAYGFLTTTERRQGGAVLLFALGTAFLEVLGVASILPFLSVLTNPGLIQSNSWLNAAYVWIGSPGERQFLFVLGALVLGIILTTQAFAAYAQWAELKFLRDLDHGFSVRLMGEYLRRPYRFFLDQNSADLNRRVLQEVREIVRGIIQPSIQLISKGLIVVGIAAFLFWIEPAVTLLLVGLAAGAYSLIHFKIHSRVRRHGANRNEANQARYVTASEGFNGIKDIKILGRESYFLERYSKPSYQFLDADARARMYSHLPAFLMRAVAFGGIMAAVLFMMMVGMSVSQIVPLAGAFAFAGYRLIPSVHTVVGAITQFRYYEDLLEEVGQDLPPADSSHTSRPQSLEPFEFHKQIQLDCLSFRYERDGKLILDNLQVQIAKDSSVAFVGSTGAGKTTLIDVILGLLSPTEGEIRIDGQPLTERDMQRWQRNIGYVPQEIYLSDAPIRNNIAYGLPDEEIEEQAVRRAAKIAHIDEFISTLPDGYDTVVGERGVRLSGGQKQRIGIARALYHDPQVLVMDEATSDIDSITEARIGDALDELSGTKTMVIVAHRLSTIRHCDAVHLMEDGRIVASGTYDELASKSSVFRKMTRSIESGSPV